MKIFVETVADKAFILEVEPSDTIEDVKNKIWQKEGIDQTRLFFSGKELLNDTEILNDYKIKEGSSLYLAYSHSKYAMKIFVKVTNGETLVVEVEPTDMIKTVKAKIQNRESIVSSHIRLLFSGKELKDEEFLNDHNIEHGSVLYLITPTKCKMQIFLKTPNGKTLTMDVKPLDMIKIVKSKIEEQEGISPNEIRMLFIGKELEDEKTFTHYNIEKGSLLHSVFCSYYCIPVMIKVLDQTILNLHVEPSDSVEEVKSRIQKQAGIAPDRIKLFIAGNPEELNDDDMLWECNVHKGSVFLIVSRISEKRAVSPFKYSSKRRKHSIEIYVKTLTGKTLTVSAEPSTTILYLKIKIFLTGGFAIDHQRVIYSGKQLEDDKTLEYYKIQNESTCHLVLRLAGS